MKFFTLCVGVSVVINVVLFGTLAKNMWSSGLADGVAEIQAGGAAAAKAATEMTAGARRWEELQEGDRAAQVARLRAEGFPPSMIRAIMLAQVRAQLASRQKALDTAIAGQPFWEGQIDPKLEAERRALARDERTVLRDLLGPDAENGYAAKLRRIWPDLPVQKIEQIAQIRERYDEQRNDVFARVRTVMLPDEGPKLDMIEKAAHAELATVLTPQELDAYGLRESITAFQLRHQLAAFDATEQEFRMLFKLQSDFDGQFGRPWGGNSPEQMRARRDGEQQLTEQIKAALGPERYAEYQRGTDYNYRRTTQLVARLNLPPETAGELHAMQQSTQERAAELRRRAASPAERTALLGALVAEAEAAITARLGAAGLEAYRTNGGTWLNNLGPRPASPPRQ